MMPNDTTLLFQSATIRGILVVLIPTVGRLLGFEITDVPSVAADIVIFAGAAYALYGRSKANIKPLSITGD